MDMDGEVLDWGAEDDDHIDRPNDADDMVSLGGEEDDMQELVAFQSRAQKDTINSPVDPPTRPSYNERAREHRHESAEQRKPPPRDAHSPPREMYSSDRGLSPRRSQSQKGHLLHASLPPKPISSNSQRRGTSQGSLMSASAMSEKQRAQEREKNEANDPTQHPVIDEYGPLPPDWEIRRPRGAENSGQIYYYNTRTEQSQWHRPSASESPRKDRAAQDDEPRGPRHEAHKTDDNRSEKHMEARDSGRNGSRATPSSLAQPPDMTYDDRHYRPTSATGLPAAKPRAPPRGRDRSPPFVLPAQVSPRAKSPAPRYASPPRYRQERDGDRLPRRSPSPHMSSRAFPIEPPSHPRRDSLSTRPTDRVTYDVPPRLSPRSSNAPLPDRPSTDRRGPQTRPPVNGFDVPPPRRDPYRAALPIRDSRDAPRPDSTRLPPQRRPRSRSPSPVRDFQQTHGRDVGDIHTSSRPTAPLRSEQELTESQRAVQNAWKAVSQRRQEPSDHPPRRPRDADDQAPNGPAGDIKRRRMNDNFADYNPSRASNDARTSDYPDSRRYSGQQPLVRPESPPYQSRQQQSRPAYDTQPHLPPNRPLSNGKNDYPPTRLPPPPSQAPPVYRSAQGRLSPPRAPRDNGSDVRAANAPLNAPAGPRRTIPTRPSSDHRDNRDPPLRVAPSAIQRPPPPVERVPNRPMHSDNRRETDYDHRPANAPALHRASGHDSDHMDIDATSRNRPRSPYDRYDDLPPRGPADRRVRDVDVGGQSYDRVYDRERSRDQDWGRREEIVPKQPRALSSRSSVPSPTSPATTMPSVIASTVLGHSVVHADAPRGPPPLEHDDPRPRASVHPNANEIGQEVASGKRHSRFGAKPSVSTHRHEGGEWRENLDVPISASPSASIGISRGSSYTDLPNPGFVNGDRDGTRLDAVADENPFDEDIYIEEKRSEVKSVFNNLLRQTVTTQIAADMRGNEDVRSNTPHNLLADEQLKTQTSPHEDRNEAFHEYPIETKPPVSRGLSTRASRFSRPKDDAPANWSTSTERDARANDLNVYVPAGTDERVVKSAHDSLYHPTPPSLGPGSPRAIEATSPLPARTTHQDSVANERYRDTSTERHNHSARTHFREEVRSDHQPTQSFDRRSVDAVADGARRNQQEIIVRDYAKIEKEHSVERRLSNLGERRPGSRNELFSERYERDPHPNDRADAAPPIHPSRAHPSLAESSRSYPPSAPPALHQSVEAPRSTVPIRIRRPVSATTPRFPEETQGGYGAEEQGHVSLGRKDPLADGRDKDRPERAENERLKPMRSTSTLLERMNIDTRDREPEGGPPSSQPLSLRDRVEPTPRRRFGGADHCEPPRAVDNSFAPAQEGTYNGDGPRRGRGKDRPVSARGRRRGRGRGSQ